MLNKFNTLSLSFLFLMFVLAWGTTTAFAAETTIYNPSFVMTANGERAESDIIDSDPADIDVKCGNSMRGAITWIIFHRRFKCGFEMTVSNNKVKEYENQWIDFPGYYNKSFTGTSTSVELSFMFNSGSRRYCFHMVATVTGFNNDIHCHTWVD